MLKDNMPDTVDGDEQEQEDAYWEDMTNPYDLTLLSYSLTI
jgi:hypothetical protein